MYLKRFYIKVEVRRTNPYLMMATALYLACKMEECPQHIRLVAQEARQLWPAEFGTFDSGKIGECEFFLISEMHSQLIVHQPYRTLTALQGDFSLTPDETTLAWTVINDHYMTDLPLVYPPHIIALTAILLSLVVRPPMPPGAGGAGGTGAAGGGLQAAAAVLQQAQARAAITGGAAPPTSGMTSTSGDNAAEKKAPQSKVGKLQRFAAWLAESDIDIEAMIDSCQELLAFYECQEQYNEKFTKEQINRYVKARGLDK
jgi:cyclin C